MADSTSTSEWVFRVPLKFAKPFSFPAPATRLVNLPVTRDSPGVGPLAHVDQAAFAMLRAAPYGLTVDSSIFGADALAAILESISKAGQSDADAVTLRPERWLVQCSGDVLIVLLDGVAPSSASSITAWKRTVGQHRLLVLEADRVRPPLLDTFFAKSSGDPKEPEAGGVSFHVVLCRIDALLSWIRASIRCALHSGSDTASLVSGGTTAGAGTTGFVTSMWVLQHMPAPTGSSFLLTPLPTCGAVEVHSPLLLEPDVISNLLMPAGPVAPSAPKSIHRHASSVSAPTPAPGSLRRGADAASAAAAASSAAPASSPPGVSLAIIVPFRDQPLQNRGEQLRRFAEAMPAFLRRAPHAVRDFHIIVAEQSEDGWVARPWTCWRRECFLS